MPKTKHKNWALNLSTFCLCLSLLACVDHDGRSENAPALTDLIEALQAPDVSDREDAAWDIGKLGPAAKAATPALIDVLRSLDSAADNQSELSDYAVWALGKIGPDAIPALIDAFKDSNKAVRRHAVVALGYMGPAAAPAVAELMNLFEDENYWVRESAVKTIGKMGPLIIPALINRLNNSNENMRQYIVRALGELGPASVPALIKTLKDPNPAVRGSAMNAIGNFGLKAQTAIPALIEALDDQVTWIGNSAATALVKSGPAAVPALIEALRSKSENVRRHAADSLGRLGPDAVAAIPMDLIDSYHENQALHDTIKSAKIQQLGRLYIAEPEAEAEAEAEADTDGQIKTYNKPNFPWPPPKASAQKNLSDSLFRSAPEELIYLRDVDTRLSNALSAAGYSEKGYFSVPEGFAVVTRMEQLNRDGTPKTGAHRWSVKIDFWRDFSLLSYIRALFTSEPGYFRVIVFVVTSEPFHQGIEVSRKETDDWLRRGLNKLPIAIAKKEFTNAYTCTAIAYEFEKVRGKQAAKEVIPGILAPDSPGHPFEKNSALLSELRKRI